ncbi:MAG: hypothetical protein D6674_02610 [Acidobacteria bacterium]|nr:MAG: hypothetical protein D6674_02610 [Acidobacteriota bacterium]
MIVVVMGLSGGGKSYIASILHEDFGFEWLRSDLIRKELAGLKPTQKLDLPYGEGIYSPQWTMRVYEEMLKRAKELSNMGKDVVLDATFLEDWQRQMVRSTFPEALFLLAYADEEEILRRLRSRVDISDANVEVYRKQKEKFVAPHYATVVNTQKSREELKAVLQRLLFERG